MRTALIAISILILVSSVSAATEKWVYPGEPFTFEGETYYAFTDTSRQSVILQSNNTKLILDIGECENENFVRYCFEEVASTTDLDHIKFDTDNNILYGMKVSLEALGPKIKATQKYTTTAPDVNGRVDGEITVQNTGNQRAYAVEILWVANDTATLRACSECERSTRSFTKRFSSLDVDESRLVAFSFNVDQPRSFSSEAYVTYEYEGESGEVGPIKQAFSIKKPYTATLSRPGKAPVGEWIDLTFTVKNTGDNDITITATPIENASLRYENAPFNDARSLVDMKLEPGESESYAYRVVSTNAGTYRTGFAVDVRRGTESFEEELSQTLEWTLDDVALIAQVSKRAPASGDSNTLFVNIENRGSLVFRNLDVAYEGEISDETSIASIGTDKLLEPFEERFTHPKTDVRLEREFTVTLRYDTQYGEEQESMRTVPYTIIPINESYAIRRVVNPREPKIGDQFTVSVYGRKTVDSAVRYSHVEDRLIGGRIDQGNHRLIPIESPDEELLYQYEATRTDERFAIITSVDATFLEQEARIREVYTTFNLSDEEVDETIDETPAGEIVDEPEESEEAAPPEAEPEASDPFAEREEEQGFFARIASWFRNLFG